MVYLLALITLLFMAACPASAGPRSSTPPIETAAKGIAAGWGWDILADAELDRRLDECARLGARWIRFDVPWADIQANGADSWNWHRSDSIIPGVVARGMKPLPILDTTPSWARPAPTDSYW